MVIFLGLALFLRQACISSKLVEFRTCICGMSSRKANLFQRSTEKGEGKSCLCVSYHRFGMIWGSQDACQLHCHVSTVIKNIIWSTTFCQLPTSSQQCCNMTSLVSGRFRWSRWPSNSLHGPSSKLKHLKPSQTIIITSSSSISSFNCNSSPSSMKVSSRAHLQILQVVRTFFTRGKGRQTKTKRKMIEIAGNVFSGGIMSLCNFLHDDMRRLENWRQRSMQLELRSLTAGCLRFPRGLHRYPLLASRDSLDIGV